jgi:hypothetical protein
VSQYKSLIQICDAAIRAGKPHEAGRRISLLTPSRVPREWRLPLAKICRRAGVYSFGLRLLQRLALDAGARKRGLHATADELTEYAALLLRSGAVDEALERLVQIEREAGAEALLIRAFAHFARWEYAQAIPFLEKYVQSDLSADALLVGQSNLAFARVECGAFEHAMKLTDENIRRARKKNHFYLENYNHALRAQIYLQEHNLKFAREEVNLALRRFEGWRTNTHFFATKLQLILDGLETRSLQPFAELRKQAAAHQEWHALREADLYSLKVHFEKQRFLHLYFGSPLVGFRECIVRELGQAPAETHFLFGAADSPCFDLASGLIDGHQGLRAGFKSHQLLSILLRDLYQPLRLAGLHSALFQGQQFDLASSPDRVHQILRRTRRWLAASNIPGIIREDHGFYSLVINGPFSFRIPLESAPMDQFTLQMSALRRAFERAVLFSAEEIERELGISIASAHRLLSTAIELQMIERIGAVKRPKGYRFTVSANEKVA